MQTSQISQSANQVNSTQASYPPRPKQQAAAVQAAQSRSKTAQTNLSDTVSFSKEALQKQQAGNETAFAGAKTAASGQYSSGRISVKA
jgi:hypothetical protein